MIFFPQISLLRFEFASTSNTIVSSTFLNLCCLFSFPPARLRKLFRFKCNYTEKNTVWLPVNIALCLYLPFMSCPLAHAPPHTTSLFSWSHLRVRSVLIQSSPPPLSLSHFLPPQTWCKVKKEEKRPLIRRRVKEVYDLAPREVLMGKVSLHITMKASDAKSHIGKCSSKLIDMLCAKQISNEFPFCLFICAKLVSFLHFCDLN